MKKLALAIISTALFVTAPAAENPSDPQTAYAKAVASYVEAAARETSVYRQEVEALASKGSENPDVRIEEIRGQLDRCDKLVAALKKATPRDFDKIKAEYERERAVLLKALEGARKS